MPFNLVVILGPTATGKTRLGALLAARFNGEVISADSRQVYRQMNLGTGKDLADYSVNGFVIPYHLIDIAGPTEEYNLYRFKNDFYNAFSLIKSRDRLPFLVGGTGLYLSSVVQNYSLQKAAFEDARPALMEKETGELRQILKNLNPALHNTTDLIDRERIINAIIIASAQTRPQNSFPEISPLVIGVNPGREVVKNRITERLKIRLKSGMIEEVENLLKNNISYEKLLFFGLEYKFIAMYLKGELNYNDMFQKLNSAIHQFAKRQMTWFRKMEREGVNINWIEGPDFDSARGLIEKELTGFEK
jgi:tRNA dimethylallyltransferase